MNKLVPYRLALIVPALLAGLGYSPASIADRYRTTQHDFGGVGLLQTPTARMAAEGEFSFNANRTSPYSRYSISVQPLPWLEGTIRYMAITNRLYGPRIAGDQSYKDKAVDVKVRLWEESYWLPDLAVGMRDIGGTGLFSSEYVVANKRFYDLDFSLGLAWGYIGNRGDFRNPWSALGSGFDTRPGRTADQVGDFNQDNYFRGRPGVFGGVEYQTPWDRLRLKLEVEGNDYQSEPQQNNQEQDSPVNLGAVFRLSDGIALNAAWERGNTAMFGITLSTNLKTGAMTPKVMDPAPEARQPASGVSGRSVDWAAVSDRLQDNGGLAVQRIDSRGDELIITAEQETYRSTAEGLGRASRILDNATDQTYDWYTLRHSSRGIVISETSIRAERLREFEQNQIDEQTMRRAVVTASPSIAHGDTLHTEPLDRTDYGLALGYNQNIGGPDGFILYQILARATGEYRFTRNQWLSGSVGINLINNFDKFRYDAPSNLPRVRTNIREYLTSSDVAIENLQYTHATELDSGLYGMAYAGLLESMFGGAGAEVLMRPHGEKWALGADVNWVRQRGFRRDFSFRDYSVVTGHVTGYLQTGYRNVLASASVGRYLAGDLGATLNLSRRFDNGVTVGAWVTRTDVPAEQFGEGSFDKGIYFNFPFDAFFARSTRTTGTIAWNPLTRDGGARLGRAYALYDLTNDRDMEIFESGFKGLTE